MERISAYVNVKGTETINYETEIPMRIVEPLNGEFDPIDIKAIYPELEISSEKFKINYPVLTSYADTAYMMMFIKDRAFSRRGKLNIVVIGIMSEERLDYYIDNNSDYIFSDEETKFTFSPAVESVALEMESGAASNQFYLYNPIYSPSLTTNTYEFNGSWEGIESEFNLLFDFSGTFGSGNCSVSYTPENTLIATQEYEAKIFAFGLFRAGVLASWHNFNIGLYAGFEQVQYTERNRLSYTEIGNQQIDYMSGLWMWSKVSVDISAEYDFRLNNRLRLSPVASVGLWIPVDGRVFDTDQDPPDDASYSDTWRYDLGIKFKMLINDYSYFSLKVGKINTKLDARQFLLDYSSDYELNYSQGYLALGYARKLSRMKNRK